MRPLHNCVCLDFDARVERYPRGRGVFDQSQSPAARGPERRIRPMSAVMHRALREAIRLGHRTAGPAHIVLALLDENRPSIAQQVLQENGIDRPRIEAAVARQYRLGMDEHSPRRGATAEPLWHETAGRAQGFSASLGAGADDPEHVLLALLWQPHYRWFADLLFSAETSRDGILAALAKRGVPVPQSPLPQLPPPKTQAAAFPSSRVNDVNWALRESDPSLNWGIGSDPEDTELMVVLAAADVDLATVLDDVVGEGAWRWRRRNDEVDAR